MVVCDLFRELESTRTLSSQHNWLLASEFFLNFPCKGTALPIISTKETARVWNNRENTELSVWGQSPASVWAPTHRVASDRRFIFKLLSAHAKPGSGQLVVLAVIRCVQKKKKNFDFHAPDERKLAAGFQGQRCRRRQQQGQEETMRKMSFLQARQSIPASHMSHAAHAGSPQTGVDKSQRLGADTSSVESQRQRVTPELPGRKHRLGATGASTSPLHAPRQFAQPSREPPAPRPRRSHGPGGPAGLDLPILRS